MHSKSFSAHYQVNLKIPYSSVKKLLLTANAETHFQVINYVYP